MSHHLDLRFVGAAIAALLASLVIALAISGGSSAPTASASPGGLDRYGGHHCWTSCGRYGLSAGDYHCHRDTRKCRRANRRHARHGH